MTDERLDPYAERILAAARRQLLEHGLKRTSLADIAAAAGVAEATLYRRFSSRDELLGTLFERETRAFIAQLDEHTAGGTDPVERLVDGFVFFMTTLRRQELAARLVQTDPEVVLPMLTTGGGAWIALARDYVAAQISAATADGELRLTGPPEQVAELLIRISHSLFLTPETKLPVADADELAAFARATLAPLVLSGEHRRARR